jgi:hypothetical protein
VTASATSSRGRVALALLGAVALVLIVVELALGAATFGQPRLADPCTATPGATGGGINGLVQRLARSTLNGAACELHTTREELVLSFVPAAGTKRIRWDRATIDRALRAGLSRAGHEVAGNGILGGALSFTLSNVFAPTVEWFLEHAT